VGEGRCGSRMNRWTQDRRTAGRISGWVDSLMESLVCGRMLGFLDW
jgi:hypothetical protein